MEVREICYPAATQMATRACRRLPVLDRVGAVVGVVTMDDLVVVFSDQIVKLPHTVRHDGVKLTEAHATP